MAWGGGFGGGPPGGFGGPGALQSNAAAGLPFAGVPDELQARVAAILDREPEHPEPEVTFSPSTYDHRPFTLRRFLAPHRWALVGALALVVLETAAVQAGPLLTQKGIDDGIVAGSVEVLAIVAGIYALSVVVSIVAGALRTAWTGRVGEQLLYELRIRVFSHLQRLSLDYFTDEKAGRVMTRMTSDIDALAQLFQDGLVSLAVQGLTMVVVTVILFTIDPSLALVTVLVVVPSMTALTLWFRSASDRGYNRVRDRIAEVLAHLSESLSGIRIIAAFNRRRYDVAVHRSIVGGYRDANVHTSDVNALYGPATDLVGGIGQLVVLAVGGQAVLRGDLTIGQLTAFVLYLTAFFAPIQQLVQLYTVYQSGQAATRKLAELLATAPTVAERPDASALPPIEGRIELRGVTFGYGRGDADAVLRAVDLVVQPGETLALVGPTGSGKSTIAKLVVRLYDADEGAVLVDGHDVRDVTLASLRSQLGVVPQEPFLFVGTVRDNVGFARPDATDDELLAACRAVGLDDLLERLPGGLDGIVHERGASLSSGERQLMALARAFVAQPRVLVLDEATSNLDLRSEAQVERALDALLEGRTALIIAHRLATARRADRIGVVVDGRLVELGSHDELVAAGGRYAAMHDAWMSHLA
jgi:ATP-binding cassette subfamily B protein